MMRAIRVAILFCLIVLFKTAIIIILERNAMIDFNDDIDFVYVSLGYRNYCDEVIM